MNLKNILGGWSLKRGETSQIKDYYDLIAAIKKDPNNQDLKERVQNAFKKDPAQFMTGLIRYQHSLYKKDLKDFLSAREVALDPNDPRRLELYEFYLDMELDPFIYGIVHNKRILKVSNKRFRVLDKKTKKENEELTDLLRTAWMNDFIKYSLQSKFWGHSLIYFSDWNDANQITRTKLVYREHVVPEKNLIVKTSSDMTGMDFTTPPFSNFMIGVGHEEDLGLYEKAAILYILRKHSWGNWDEFEEKFGIPILWAKTASQDKKVRKQMEEWLKNMGSSSYGLFPSDSELNVIDSKYTDAFQVFSEKIKAANEELEILFTGQKRVTSQGGSYGKEITMMEESEEVVTDDKNFLGFIINGKLLPLLRNAGYPVSDADCFEWDDTKQLSQKEQMEIAEGLGRLGYKLDEKELEERFGFTITGIKEPVVTPGAPPKKKETEPGKSKPTSEFDQIIAMHLELNKLYSDVH